MFTETSKKDDCWVYKEPTQTTCLLDKQSGKITANIFKVPLNSILYITSSNSKKGYIKFISSKGIEYYKRLSLIEIVNANDNFIFIKKDTIVNVSLVDKRCEWLYLWIGDHKLKVSRHFRKNLQQKFESFVL
ncbi:LytTR family DNA-binding domain-containing protein [Polaribacter sp. Z022]|uniref:LytTR family DNA-binding domain-containing protein n=1 Tax=Polaribacter sp. Z022 TaxID=2927125 RepID=UPI002021CD03|nr:LytTR family DNA-binding domain-containing protein [Polaribacter sp. Z022]MCL7752440.1 LytTR family transcriptional regulator [Polaribacter sp. Z022]